MCEGVVVIASLIIVLDLGQSVRLAVDDEGHLVHQPVGNAGKGGLVLLERGVLVAHGTGGQRLEMLVLKHVEQPPLVHVFVFATRRRSGLCGRGTILLLSFLGFLLALQLLVLFLLLHRLPVCCTMMMVVTMKKEGQRVSSRSN
jgi:hypothetical protein